MKYNPCSLNNFYKQAKVFIGFCYDPNRRTNKIGGRGQECTELISAGIRKWSINRDQWRMPVIYSSSPHM